MFRIANISRASKIGIATRSAGSFDLIMSIALKLTSLAIRTIAKPIGTVIKLQAKEHPRFRKGCVQLAQSIHQLDVNLKIKLLGQKNIKVRPLNENKAIENGANLISEGFIFSVAGALIFYESYRQRKKELTRREAVADDISMLQEEIEYLKKNLSQYVRVEDYKPSKEFHPTVLKIASKDQLQEQPVKETEQTGAAAAKPNTIINLILTKLGDDQLNLFSEKDTLKITDKKLFKEAKDNILYLKVEKIGE